MENNLRILDFMSTWCQPCRTMSPILDEITKETGIEIRKIDVDDNEEICNEYDIRNIPTLIFIKDGVVVDRISGTTNKINLINKINEHSK